MLLYRHTRDRGTALLSIHLKRSLANSPLDNICMVGGDIVPLDQFLSDEVRIPRVDLHYDIYMVSNYPEVIEWRGRLGVSTFNVFKEACCLVSSYNTVSWRFAMENAWFEVTKGHDASLSPPNPSVSFRDSPPGVSDTSLNVRTMTVCQKELKDR